MLGFSEITRSGLRERKADKTRQKSRIGSKESRIESRTFSDRSDGAGVPVIEAPPLIIEDDFGRYQVGLHDDAPSFETRGFAIAIAQREARRAQVRS